MTFDLNNIESSLFDLLDQVKILLSQETWENILLNSTKNELLVFLILYRTPNVNMSQIADYLGVPLNTATGIVSRMEKKNMLERIRSQEDKRVVLIVLTEVGQEQINKMMAAFIVYGQKLMTSLTPDEIALIGTVVTKVIKILQDEEPLKAQATPAVRRITIE